MDEKKLITNDTCAAHGILNETFLGFDEKLDKVTESMTLLNMRLLEFLAKYKEQEKTFMKLEDFVKINDEKLIKLTTQVAVNEAILIKKSEDIDNIGKKYETNRNFMYVSAVSAVVSILLMIIGFVLNKLPISP